MHLTGHFHNCLSHIWMDPECYRNPERSVSRTQSRRCLRMPDVLQKMCNYNYTCSLVACWGPLQGLVPVYPPWVLSATVFHPHTLLSSTKENGYSVLEDDILWNQRAAPDFAWSASAHLHTLWCSLNGAGLPSLLCHINVNCAAFSAATATTSSSRSNTSTSRSLLIVQTEPKS